MTWDGQSLNTDFHSGTCMREPPDGGQDDHWGENHSLPSLEICPSERHISGGISNDNGVTKMSLPQVPEGSVPHLCPWSPFLPCPSVWHFCFL